MLEEDFINSLSSKKVTKAMHMTMDPSAQRHHPRAMAIISDYGIGYDPDENIPRRGE